MKPYAKSPPCLLMRMLRRRCPGGRPAAWAGLPPSRKVREHREAPQKPAPPRFVSGDSLMQTILSPILAESFNPLLRVMVSGAEAASVFGSPGRPDASSGNRAGGGRRVDRKEAQNKSSGAALPPAPPVGRSVDRGPCLGLPPQQGASMKLPTGKPNTRLRPQIPDG